MIDSLLGSGSPHSVLFASAILWEPKVGSTHQGCGLLTHESRSPVISLGLCYMHHFTDICLVMACALLSGQQYSKGPHSKAISRAWITLVGPSRRRKATLYNGLIQPIDTAVPVVIWSK